MLLANFSLADDLVKEFQALTSLTRKFEDMYCDLSLEYSLCVESSDESVANAWERESINITANRWRLVYWKPFRDFDSAQPFLNDLSRPITEDLATSILIRNDKYQAAFVTNHSANKNDASQSSSKWRMLEMHRNSELKSKRFAAEQRLLFAYGIDYVNCTFFEVSRMDSLKVLGRTSTPKGVEFTIQFDGPMRYDTPTVETVSHHLTVELDPNDGKCLSTSRKIDDSGELVSTMNYTSFENIPVPSMVKQEFRSQGEVQITTIHRYANFKRPGSIPSAKFQLTSYGLHEPASPPLSLPPYLIHIGFFGTGGLLIGLGTVLQKRKRKGLSNA